MIYLAPLQGFTDYVYRKAYSTLFDEIDTFFIPYISVKNNKILKKNIKEIILTNNPQTKVIPQVLARNSQELIFLASNLEQLGYSEINLNLGCPYPMVTNQKKGAGLLPNPEQLKRMLSDFYKSKHPELSIKLRAGLVSARDIEKIIPVLNDFPLTEVILHPRTAKQLYSGEIILEAFQFASENLKHKLVYNGEIYSNSDYEERKKQFPGVNCWMLGRGILMNTFLPSEIKGVSFISNEKVEKLKGFHDLVYEGYVELLDNAGNVLNKLKQFWSYFSYNFPDQRKTFKSIKKSKNINEYEDQVQRAFYNLY